MDDMAVKAQGIARLHGPADQIDLVPLLLPVRHDLQAMVAEDDLLYYIDVANPLLKSDGQVMTDIFVEDGLHLNEKGTDIWAASIKQGFMPVEARFESAHH